MGAKKALEALRFAGIAFTMQLTLGHPDKRMSLNQNVI
jgi:hypothetical protein